MSYVSKPVRKKDAMALVTGKPVFTNEPCAKTVSLSKSSEVLMQMPGLKRSDRNSAAGQWDCCCLYL